MKLICETLPWEEGSIIERVPYPSALWEVTTEERMADAEQKNSSSCSSVAMVTFLCLCKIDKFFPKSQKEVSFPDAQYVEANMFYWC